VRGAGEAKCVGTVLRLAVREMCVAQHKVERSETCAVRRAFEREAFWTEKYQRASVSELLVLFWSNAFGL